MQNANCKLQNERVLESWSICTLHFAFCILQLSLLPEPPTLSPEAGARGAREEDTMSVENAFLADILADPKDDTPRLIFADWLQERGDPRGEFIHVQCQLAALPPGDQKWKGLHDREQELLNLHRATWLDLPAEHARYIVFQRGFPA